MGGLFELDRRKLLILVALITVLNAFCVFIGLVLLPRLFNLQGWTWLIIYLICLSPIWYTIRFPKWLYKTTDKIDSLIPSKYKED